MTVRRNIYRYILLLMVFVCVTMIVGPSAAFFFNKKKEGTSKEKSEAKLKESSAAKKLAQKVLTLQKKLLQEKVKRRALEKKIKSYEKQLKESGKTPAPAPPKSTGISRDKYLQAVKEAASSHLKIKKTERELQTIKKTLGTYQKENKSLKQKLSSAGKQPPGTETDKLAVENKNLSQLIEKQKQKIERLSAKLKEQKKKTGWSIFKSKKEKKEEKTTGSEQGKLRSLKSKYALLKASSKLKERKLQNEIEKLKKAGGKGDVQKIKKLEEDIKRLRTMQSTIQSVYQKTAAENKKYKQEIAALKTQGRGKTKQIADNKTIEKFKELYKKNQESYSKLKGAAETLQKENEGLKQKISELKRSGGKSGQGINKDQLAVIKGKLKKIEIGYNLLKAKTKLTSKKYGDMQKQIEILKKEIETRDTKIALLQKKSGANKTSFFSRFKKGGGKEKGATESGELRKLKSKYALLKASQKLKEKQLEAKIKKLENQNKTRPGVPPGKELKKTKIELAALRAQNEILKKKTRSVDGLRQEINNKDKEIAELKKQGASRKTSFFSRFKKGGGKEKGATESGELRKLKSKYALLKASQKLKEKQLGQAIKKKDEEIAKLKKRKSNFPPAGSSTGSGLKKELKTLKTRNALLKASQKLKEMKLNDEIASLKKQLQQSPGNKADGNIKQMKARIAMLAAENNLLKKKKELSKSKPNPAGVVLKKKVDELSGRIARLENEKKEFESQRQKNEKYIAEMSNSIKGLKSTYESRITLLKKQVSGVSGITGKMESLKKSIMGKDKYIEELKRSIENMNKKYEADMVKLKDKYSFLKPAVDISKLEKTISELAEQNQKKEYRITELKMSMEKLKESVGRLQKKLARKESLVSEKAPETVIAHEKFFLPDAKKEEKKYNDFMKNINIKIDSLFSEQEKFLNDFKTGNNH